MSLFEGKYPFTVTVLPVPESERWMVNLCEGETLIYHSKESKTAVRADAKKIAATYHIQVTCSLDSFLDLTIESDRTGIETWATDEGFALEWSRTAYSRDRQGLDSLKVWQGNEVLKEFFLYASIESDVVVQIIDLIAPGKQGDQIFGHLE